ncbi:hypothetical protein ZOSMA_6G02210 [Zostera marina]|uniref:AB hydrolase-1 domain-containing protein n=1 Tax=Zostera marina TaxID=29655 RepID=A0A0K9NR82_ZOSMR|nr:hypothetical protein ZOSMA_6G02210 [Zostera marina]
MAPWQGSKVNVPVKFITGDEDIVYTMLGNKEFIHNGNFKKNVPMLQDVIIMEGVGHFLQQEKPQEITDHIYQFIKNL